MEVSSHSIAQERIAGLQFAGAMFTNLTRDHIDYHKTFDNYRDTKKRLFDGLRKEAFAVTDADDKNGLVMTQNTRAKVFTYSTQSMADHRGKILEEGFDGMNLEMDGREVFVRFVGRFNVQNLLAVYGALRLLNVPQEEALVTLSLMKPVNGRFETISSPKGVTAIVDYAHTPDALENVLTTINEVISQRKEGEVWTVCGAGGNRDKGKRPLMAQEAVKQSQRVIITSDNPRDEDPNELCRTLAELIQADHGKCEIIVEREAAVRKALQDMAEGDVLILAGKGPETSITIGNVTYPYPGDAKLASDFINSL
jgi:UDP-N-acetylmuramoyl-L-alanyl-D-glutamate--2,6-diaminopimelate ligase